MQRWKISYLKPSNCVKADFKALASLQCYNNCHAVKPVLLACQVRKETAMIAHSRETPKSWDCVAQHLGMEICLNPTDTQMEEEGRKECKPRRIEHKMSTKMWRVEEIVATATPGGMPKSRLQWYHSGVKM